jgi:hypothetical protein
MSFEKTLAEWNQATSWLIIDRRTEQTHARDFPMRILHVIVIPLRLQEGSGPNFIYLRYELNNL